MYYIVINDGICRSISATSQEGVISAVAEYYGEPVETVETDDGDVLAIVGGPHIGFMRRVS